MGDGDDPYRPQPPKDAEDSPPEAVQLMYDCWIEDPGARPDFGIIKKKLRSLNSDRYYLSSLLWRHTGL